MPAKGKTGMHPDTEKALLEMREQLDLLSRMLEIVKATETGLRDLEKRLSALEGKLKK